MVKIKTISTSYLVNDEWANLDKDQLKIIHQNSVLKKVESLMLYIAV